MTRRCRECEEYERNRVMSAERESRLRGLLNESLKIINDSVEPGNISGENIARVLLMRRIREILK